MFRLQISRSADADLLGIFETGLEQFGAAVALGYRDGLAEAFGRLLRYLMSGRGRPDIDETVRSIPFRSHVIFYDVDGQDVIIQRVLHGAMDAKAQVKAEAADE